MKLQYGAKSSPEDAMADSIFKQPIGAAGQINQEQAYIQQANARRAHCMALKNGCKKVNTAQKGA